jgi:hypothetical protein
MARPRFLLISTVVAAFGGTGARLALGAERRRPMDLERRSRAVAPERAKGTALMPVHF